MIAVLGFATIIIFLYVTMTKKLSIQSALIGIPVIAAIIGGFGFDIGKMMIAGVIKVTPSAMIPIFAVIYFGIMIDAGLFDPMVNRILKLVKGDPVKITIGAAGSGNACFAGRRRYDYFYYFRFCHAADYH